MGTDLRTQIGELVDGGTSPVSFGEIKERQMRAAPALRREDGGPGRWFRRGRLAAVAVGLTAAGCAAALAVSQPGGPAVRPRAGATRIVLTAAMVRHVASASRSALAASGEAVISYRNSQGGVLQDYGTDDVTFSGANWNFVIRDTAPATGGQPADTQYAINRIVDGQAYYYIKAMTNRLQWIHDTNPDAVHGMGIPDPRTLLGVLEPGARFEVAGYQTTGGVRLEDLRATDVSGMTSLMATLPEVMPGEHVTALDLWVDAAGVVHRLDVELAGTQRVYHFQLKHTDKNGRVSFTVVEAPARKGSGVKVTVQALSTSVSVTFLHIGQPQVITAPKDATNVYGHG
jgi:hypothetical protein